ncbi:MAG: tRNA preQ1(34) S-adenosylmethionine ribosyltransferase-isomerase QueA [Clostridia bacterium]|nr:tRNA preQ1(34) S-adenosylmethionine ribosyltransferase-isomerase QueA [Clostridia bacterium]
MKNLLERQSYFYDLPEELIAQTPIEKRDMSRLLVYHKKSDTTEHKVFKDIVDYFKKGDVLVVNNTKVLPARLYAYKPTGAKIEILLLKKLTQTSWEVLIRPSKRIKEGDVLTLSEELQAEIVEKRDFGNTIVDFKFEGVFENIIDKIGLMPLPHYIREKLEDKNRYQTIYAKTLGSSACPTAGLHFTDEVLEKLRQKGVEIVKVLLHVGLGTFRPVSEDNILDHKMHTEYYKIDQEACDKINKAKKEGHRIFACGTTSVRTLESVATKYGELKADEGDTNIFIYPGYEFKVVDALITNFHLPESTLIMLVSAFIGYEECMKEYNIAVNEKYRFYSFGDSSLWLKE